MNSRTRRWSVIVAVWFGLAVPQVMSQETSLLASFDNLNLGPTAVQPFLKNGFQAPFPWYGAEVMVGPLHWSVAWGEYFPDGTTAENERRTGFIASGGMTFPLIPWLAEGRYSFESVRVVPFIDAGVAYAEVGDDGVEDKAFSWGLVFAPGLRLRIPFLYADIRANGLLLFNNNFITRKDNQNAFAGAGFAPSVTLGIDGLYELLSGAHYEQTFSEWVTRSETTGSSKIVRDAGDHDGDGDYTELVERTEYSTRTWQELEHKTYEYTLGPSFWGAGVKSYLHPGSLERGWTGTIGPALTARFGFLAVDVYYQYGFPGDSSGGPFRLAVTDEAVGHIAGATVGVDAIKIGMPDSMRPDASAPLLRQQGSMGRLLVRGTYQTVWDQGELAPTSGFGLGVGFELGAASLAWDHLWYPNESGRTGDVFSFTALTPWARVAKAISDRGTPEQE